MNICYIFAAGEMSLALPEFDNNDFIIAADAGYKHLEAQHIVPDVTVGDFDSMEVIPSGKIIRHPVMKDDTDTMLAIKVGFEKGYREFRIYGGTGGKRADHTIANIQSLAYIAKHGGHGYLIDSKANYAVIKNETLKFSKEANGIISVFSIGGTSYGVTLDGLLYPLNEATVDSFFPIGVSNHFTGVPASVTVKNGYLLVTWNGNFDETIINK